MPSIASWTVAIASGIALLALPPLCIRPNTATSLEVLRRLAGRVRHVYWLNPEPQHDWDTNDSAMSTYAPHCDQVFEVRNLRQLVACVDETTTS
jgi:uncharacterized protein with von Willebrand factor type A (vWA) domain